MTDLTPIIEYFDARADVEDGAYGEPKANEAMEFVRLLEETEAELAQARGELSDVIAAAERAGWNGVENSKILAVFIEGLAEESRRWRQRAEQAELEWEGWETRQRQTDERLTTLSAQVGAMQALLRTWREIGEQHDDIGVLEIVGEFEQALTAPAAEAQGAPVRITLTAHQLREAAEFGSPDGDPEQAETELTIQWMPERTSEDGEPLAAGFYAYYTEYPEEGVYGPLAAAPAKGEESEPDSLPLMARRSDSPPGARFYAIAGGKDFYFHGNLTAENWPESGTIYRIADTDEHGLPVVPWEPGMPEGARYIRTVDMYTFFEVNYLPAKAGLWQRIEDYRPAKGEE